MKRPLFVGLMGTLFVGCGDATGILPSDIAGTWTATEFVATNSSDPSQSQDLIALGATFSITFREDGIFTQSTGDPDGTTDPDSDTWGMLPPHGYF